MNEAIRLCQMAFNERLMARPQRNPKGTARKDDLLIGRIVFPFPVLM